MSQTTLRLISRGICLTLLLVATPWTSQAQTIKRLSPEAEQRFTKQVAAYPPFDAAKAKAEAAQKYRTVQRGENAAVFYRNQKVEGAFQGIEGRVLKLADRKLALIDIPEEQLNQFSEEYNRSERTHYLNIALLAWQDGKLAFERKLRDELYAKYPAFDEPEWGRMLSKLPDGLREKSLSELASAFNKGLPLTKPLTEHKKTVIAEFLKQHPEIIQRDSFLISRLQLEAEAQKLKQIEELRAKKSLAESFAPSAATPIITPDGGIFLPGMRVSLKSSTPDAEIHYTLDGSEPDELSPLYEEAFTVNEILSVKAKAFHPVFKSSDTAIQGSWDAHGLSAAFFPKLNFSGEAAKRIDRTIDFDWGLKNPLPNIPPDFFSAIWAGQLIVPDSGNYAFYLSGASAMRLWLDGKLLIDEWNEGSPRETQATVKLETGKAYDLKVTLAACSGPAAIRLEWSGPGFRREVLRPSCLLASGPSASELEKWNTKEFEVYIKRPSMRNPGANEGSLLFKANPELRQPQFEDGLFKLKEN